MSCVLISVESLNPRYLQYFGSPKPTTPHLAQLQQESLNFFNCFANAGFTPITMKALHTGNLQVNLTQDTWMDKVSRPTIAECLRNAGHKTAGFVGFGHVGSKIGFDRGFETFDEPLPGDDPNRSNKYEWVRLHYDAYKRINGDEIGFHMGNWFVDRLLSFIVENKDRPFFAYGHYAETHVGAERALPQKYIDMFPNQTDQNGYYHAKLKWMDEELIAPLVATLKEQGIYEDTTIVILGDHGEAFGKHGEPTHGLWAYNEGLRVPLIIKSPQVGELAGQRIMAGVRNIDVMPTILAIAGVEHPPNDGTDLVAFCRDGAREPLMCYMENYGTIYSGDHRGIVQGDFKYLRRYNPYKIVTTRKNPDYEAWRSASPVPAEELFNIMDDDFETINLAGRSGHRERVVEFRRLMTEILVSHGADPEN